MHQQEKNALIQVSQKSFKMVLFNGEQMISDVKTYGILSDAVSQLNESYNITLVPGMTEEEISSVTALLITSGIKVLLLNAFPEYSDCIWEVNEKINQKGKVETILTEPEINHALRYVFSKNSRHFYLSLTNSLRNPVHEETIKNVIHVAGYTAIRTKIEQ